jgi:hypothetical protein
VRANPTYLYPPLDKHLAPYQAMPWQMSRSAFFSPPPRLSIPRSPPAFFLRYEQAMADQDKTIHRSRSLDSSTKIIDAKGIRPKDSQGGTHDPHHQVLRNDVARW